MTLNQLTVIGGGQMARALVGGMIDNQTITPENVHVVDPSEPSRQWWTEHQPAVEVSAEAVKAIETSEIILIAVKPHIVGPVLTASAHRKKWKGKLVISIAAGVTLDKLSQGAGHDRVVRVMPNTPSLVGEGASGFCAGKGVSESDREVVTSMLASVGIVTEATESQMDAVTGLSGSGPAYVYLMIEALADGGVASGLPRDQALQLAAQTVRGAASMVSQTGQHPGVLKDNVCSPGGTTIAGVSKLEEKGFRGAVIEAVKTATERSRELADS